MLDHEIEKVLRDTCQTVLGKSEEIEAIWGIWGKRCAGTWPAQSGVAIDQQRIYYYNNNIYYDSNCSQIWVCWSCSTAELVVCIRIKLKVVHKPQVCKLFKLRYCIRCPQMYKTKQNSWQIVFFIHSDVVQIFFFKYQWRQIFQRSFNVELRNVVNCFMSIVSRALPMSMTHPWESMMGPTAVLILCLFFENIRLCEVEF